jgi:hypothetical protein
MHTEDLVLVGGMQNVGKTIVALQAARNMACSGDVLPIVVCYEHGTDTLLHRLLCQESIEDPDDPAPAGVTRAQIEAVVIDYYDRLARGEIQPRPGNTLNIDWLVDRLPALKRAWQRRMSDYMERLWLVRGDGIHTTIQRLERYIAMAEAKGFQRIVLIVDYAQRVPFHSVGISGVELSQEQRIDLVMRGLKGIGLKMQVPVLAVAAADAEGLRQQRVHVENLWGPSTVQYEPDIALILNRDEMDTETGERYVRLAIEKNRSGPSEVEYRHRLHGAYYCLSRTGELIPDSESFQAERIGLRAKTRNVQPGVHPNVALMLLIASELVARGNYPDDGGKKQQRFAQIFQHAVKSEDGGIDVLADLADLFSLEGYACTGA